MSNAGLSLEFAPGAGHTSLASRALLALALLAFALTALELGSVLTEAARQSRKLAALDAQSSTAAQRPAARPVPTDSAELARAQFIRQTSRSMVTPWARLFAALESTPANVALLAVEPSASSREVSLTAEAATPAQMLEYLRGLQEDTRLQGVILVSHQIQVQTVGTPVRFQMTAHWEQTP